MTKTMDGITESSRKVGEIIGIIEGIAFQTDILALNAAVETGLEGVGRVVKAVAMGRVAATAEMFHAINRPTGA